MPSTLISTTQAAEMLGMSTGRIRQLTADGAITGRVIGPRTVLYDVGEIEVYRRATRGSDSASGVATTATPAASPLPLVVDTVTAIGGRGEDAEHVHLRIWRSASRTVVLTGPVADSIGFSGWRFQSFVLPAVTADYLDGDYLGVYWINTSGSDVSGIKAHNHVFVTRSADEMSRPSRWNPLRNRITRDLDETVDATVIELDDPMSTIDALVGQTVRHFPAAELATPENIARLAATGAPVPVVVDAPALRPVAGAMLTLHQHRAECPASEVALRTLWDRLDMILETDETFREPEWMASMRLGRSLLNADHCAVVPTVDNLDDIDWRSLSGPPDPTVDELRMCWSALGSWLDVVGEHAVDEKLRNKALARALDTAMDIVHHMHRLRCFQQDIPEHPLPPYPAVQPTIFNVSPVLDEFWRSGSEGVSDSADLRRLHQAVNAHVDVEAEVEEVRFRTAVDGTLMARYRPLSSEFDCMIILWPWFTPAVERLSDGTHIVASSTRPGHTAVFLRHPDGTLKPMPRPEANRFNGWSFGPGSGPTTLGGDIGRLLEASDGITIRPRIWGTCPIDRSCDHHERRGLPGYLGRSAANPDCRHTRGCR
ncbi:hypothetical protein BJF84_17310 [Rhodococcus sp. CUA-806]|nr:hypothetical protein BJF84_17310 [Rhodococcus sp. CUA-806]